MLRAINTRKLALGLVLAVLAACVPPLRAAVLDQLGAGGFLPHLTAPNLAADGSTAVRSS
jgi:hypothetical protein